MPIVQRTIPDFDLQISFISALHAGLVKRAQLPVYGKNTMSWACSDEWKALYDPGQDGTCSDDTESYQTVHLRA